MSRISSVEKGARKRGHLEEDESVQAVAIVGHGATVVLPDLATPVSWSRAAIAATERNLYVMKLGQIGFAGIKDLAFKRPLEHVTLLAGHDMIDIGTAEEGRLATYKVIPAQSPKKLVEFVAAHSSEECKMV